MGSDTNPLNPSYTEKVSPLKQGGSSADLLVDLLSGEDLLPHPLAQPVTKNVVYNESDPLDFLDLSVENHSAKSDADAKVSSEDATHSDSSAEQYLKCLKTLAGPNLVCNQFVNVAMKHYKFSCFAHPI